MPRKLEKKNVYNAGRGKTNQELIHLHMSNHYRRILNAKKTVDNSPPNCYKGKRPATSNSVVTKNKVNRSLESPALTDRSLSTISNKGSFWGTESYSSSSRYHARCIPENPTFTVSNKQNRINMDLIDRIAYDTKNGPATYCDEGWLEENTFHNNMKESKTETKPSPSAKRRLTTVGSQESAHKRKLIAQDETKRPSKESITCALEPPNCKCTKICICDTNETVLKKISFNPKEQSLTSSRDSAYNGGVSSLPESRSPTPDERRKKECCCCCCCDKKQQQDVKLFESSKAILNRVEYSAIPQQVCRRATPKSKNQERQESLKKIQEDTLYVKFIQDITTEVLEKSLYTNNALKKVMKKHITNNLSSLNKDRMLKEVENLRLQLGIPEDETLLKVEANSDDRGSDILKLYPVISDSEFLMPINGTAENVKGTKASVKLLESNSLVLSSGTENEKTVSVSETEDDGEIISVIQVTKAIREKRKERRVQKTPTAFSRENSSDDSDSAFDSKNRSVLKNYKPKLSRSYSSSSSDSDLSRKFATHGGEKTENRIFASEKALSARRESKSSSFGKKNRNVSFWKHPEFNLSRTVEIKREKTITREKESYIPDGKRDKAKKD